MLAPYLKLKEPELAKVLNEDTGFVWLEHTMEHDTYLAVNDIIKSNKLEGLVFQDETIAIIPMVRWQPSSSGSLAPMTGD